MDDQLTRDTRGYIFEAYEKLDEMGHIESKKLHEFILEYPVPARVGDLFLDLLAEDIRTHGWKTDNIKAFVDKKAHEVSDKFLIHWLCVYGGYYAVKGVFYRAGNVWK